MQLSAEKREALHVTDDDTDIEPATVAASADDATAVAEAAGNRPVDKATQSAGENEPAYAWSLDHGVETGVDSRLRECLQWVMRVLITGTATLLLLAAGPAPTVEVAQAEPPSKNCIAMKVNQDGSCYYKNCSEAKAAGECDIPTGDPHYCSKQDRDNDGLACEC